MTHIPDLKLANAMIDQTVTEIMGCADHDWYRSELDTLTAILSAKFQILDAVLEACNRLRPFAFKKSGGDYYCRECNQYQPLPNTAHEDGCPIADVEVALAKIKEGSNNGE